MKATYPPDNFRDRAVGRLEWVLGTAHLSADVAGVLQDAVQAFAWDEQREQLSNRALESALAEIRRLRACA